MDNEKKKIALMSIAVGLACIAIVYIFDFILN